MESPFDFDVFLSFSGSDEDAAKLVQGMLLSTGLRVFFSDATLKSKLGESWHSIIESSLERSKHFILLSTPLALASRWVNFEYHTFFNSFYDPKSRLLIPLLLASYKTDSLPLFLRNIEACSLNRSDSLRLLISRLGGAELDSSREELFAEVFSREGMINDLKEDLRKATAELQAARSTRRHVHFDKIQNSQVIRHIEDMTLLHNEIAAATSFEFAKFPITKPLANFHMASYLNALEGATRRQTLPLPSIPRLEAAIDAINGTLKTIVAVSLWETDRWHLSQNETYIKANLKAVARGVTIQRVIVAENAEKLEEARQTLEQERKAGVELKFAVLENLKWRLSQMSPNGFPLRNLLICDKKILTRALNYSNHDGELTLNPLKVNHEWERFNIVWGSADL